jgi:glyoxylase-like metal-dependent hydrolase (beta-lactamase superfamily II)
VCEFHRTGRRAFLADLGRGTIAIALFTPIIGACTSSSDANGTDASSSSPPGTTGAPVSLASSPPTQPPASSTSATTATSVETASSATDPSAPITYERISFGFVSAYLLVRGDEAAVIDTGVAGSAGAIEAALGAASLNWDAIRHVILTHHHPDHAGSIEDVLTAAVNATAYAGEADVASITAPRQLSAVNDGDEVFGLQIVGTPGHTAGHISIYDPNGQVLVAGDAINNTSKLEGPNPQFTADMAMATMSAKRLAELPLETIYFGHGSPIEGGAGPRLVELALSL